jgi:hypothetical protein
LRHFFASWKGLWLPKLFLDGNGWCAISGSEHQIKVQRFSCIVVFSL